MKLHRVSCGQGPELVLLHGWGMNLAVWSELARRLTQRYRVTLIELPGHGDSDYDPACATLDDWADACLAVAPPRAAWIGWSLGGQLALAAALRQPQRVTQLLLVCASPRFRQGPGWPNAMAEQTLRQFASALALNHQQTLARFLSLQVQGDEQARETLRLLRQEVAERPEPEPQALEDGLKLLLEVDLRERLGALAVPSLWLFGERDTLAPAAVIGELEQLAIPQARFAQLAGCAHAPFLSHPDSSLRLLERFLENDDAA